jgi:hypothetical protein
VKEQAATRTRAESAAVRIGTTLGRVAARLDKLAPSRRKAKAVRTAHARPSPRRAAPGAERRAAAARAEPIKRRMLSEETRARMAAAQKKRWARVKTG